MSTKHRYPWYTRLYMWYINHFVPYLFIQQNNEHFFISKVLWQSIMDDLPVEQRNAIKVLFKKYPVDRGARYEYIMIVNPDITAEFDEEVVNNLKEWRKEEEAFEQSLKGKPQSYQRVERIRRINSQKEGKPSLFMATVQLNIFGHIGFQGVQPTPAEIVYEYMLDAKVRNKWGKTLEFTDRIPLRVEPVCYRPEVYGTRHAYRLTSDILYKPIPTFAKPYLGKRVGQ